MSLPVPSTSRGIAAMNSYKSDTQIVDNPLTDESGVWFNDFDNGISYSIIYSSSFASDLTRDEAYWVYKMVTLEFKEEGIRFYNLDIRDVFEKILKDANEFIANYEAYHGFLED